MTRENLRRVKRLVEIRGIKLASAQAEAARAERSVHEAERALREAEQRVDEAAGRAIVAGDFSIDELVDARLEVMARQRAAAGASRSRDEAEERRAERLREVERAHVAQKQMETLADHVRGALWAEEARVDRLLADELASRMRGGKR